MIRKASGDPETVVEYCTIMERQLQQLTRLVDDLLDVSDLTHQGLGSRRDGSSSQPSRERPWSRAESFRGSRP